MTATKQRTTMALPTPRSGAVDDAPGTSDAVALELGRQGSRPRHHYWDVATARWVVRGTTGTD
ncbi:hypothetical protein SAMN05660485_01368 [Blastococcus fimeti]|nr:hypothetical protein SAMN05660485_01368 [Blastococcus fimeti]